MSGERREDNLNEKNSSLPFIETMASLMQVASDSQLKADSH